MKLTRLVLVGFAALTAVAASAQILPRKQHVLVTDWGTDVNNGYVHRINAYTGGDMGVFGVGFLYRPTAIAVQPSTGVAYVADQIGIKRFNAITGDYLGALSGGNGLAYDSLRFNSAGALYAVVTTQAGAKYRVQQINPATGYAMAYSPAMPADALRKLKVAFRPNGTLEVVRMWGNHTDVPTHDEGTYVNKFTAGLSPMGTDFYPSGLEAGFDVFRASNDGFLRWTTQLGSYNGGYYYDLLWKGGMGDLGGSDPDGQIAVRDWGYPMFAEGVANRIYGFFPSLHGFTLVQYNAGYSAPYKVADFHVSPANVGYKLTDIAICWK